MRLMLLLLLLGGALTLPFAMLKQPWAVKLWRRVRMGFIIYAVVILVSAIVALIFNWETIYG